MAHHNVTLSGIGGYFAEACPTAAKGVCDTFVAVPRLGWISDVPSKIVKILDYTPLS